MLYNHYKTTFISVFLSAECNVDITVASAVSPFLLLFSTGSQILNRFYWKNNWHTDVKCTISGKVECTRVVGKAASYLNCQQCKEAKLQCLCGYTLIEKGRA